MISPSEIRNKKFDKGVKGYKTDAVDSYMEQIANDMTQLVNDKKDLEEKIGILADKLEEYKSDEDSLRDALLGAQKLGATVIKEAKAKAEGIVRDAAVKAEKITLESQKQIERERLSLQKLQKEVSVFRGKLMAIYKQHLELINALPTVNEEPAERVEALEDSKNFAENGQKAPAPENKSKQENKSAPAAAAQTPKEGDTIKFSITPNPSEVKEGISEKAPSAKEEKKSLSESGESRFGPLRFGEGYELDRSAK